MEILPELTPARLLVFVGLIRAIIGGHFIWTTKCRLDILFLIFSFFALLSSIGHTPDEWTPAPFAARTGFVINIFGTYLYGRAYLPDFTSFSRYALLLPLVVIPLAIGLSIEKRTQRNVYSIVGAARSEALMREDKVRAQGPFRHPILAGCAGATALPFAFLSWRRRRRGLAIIGSTACIGTVIACASSGPLAAVAVTLASMAMWQWRMHIRKVLWGFAGFGLLYTIVAGRGPWYLMASIDLVGGSTGWHRAKLIDQSFVHLNEWWAWGTDYTRHWMSSGMRWNPNHADITNYFIHLGIVGGLALALCLFGFLIISFRMLERKMIELRQTGNPDEFTLWCAGASLATHAISFVSISYFDQMYIFFYLLLGAIPGLVSSVNNPASSPATDNASHETEKQNEAGPELFQA